MNRPHGGGAVSELALQQKGHRLISSGKRLEFGRPLCLALTTGVNDSVNVFVSQYTVYVYYLSH